VCSDRSIIQPIGTDMTTSPGRLVQMLLDVAAAFGRRKVTHAVAGGMAVAVHGIPRATKDIDFLIDHSDAPDAEYALRSLGFAPMEGGAGAGFVRYVRHPVPGVPEITEWVDLLLARHEIGRSLLRNAAADPVAWEGIHLPVVSAEGIVLMKVLAIANDPARPQDRGDIIGLLRIHREGIDRSWIEDSAKAFGANYADIFNALAVEADADRKPGPPGFTL
jgi:hypothetical protein